MPSVIYLVVFLAISALPLNYKVFSHQSIEGLLHHEPTLLYGSLRHPPFVDSLDGILRVRVVN